MTLYAESSAVLAWLLGEPGGDGVRRALADAEAVVASDLTLVECERTLIRARGSGHFTEKHISSAQSALRQAEAGWSLLRLGRDVIERARRPFPREPLRTLDALHLASALVAREALPDLVLLSLDRRVRAAGRELGLAIAP